MKESFLIVVKGIVQGVGFRPFIHKLAEKYKINGIVYNKTGSVHIEINSSEEILKKFINDIKNKKPPACILESINFKKLKIKKSFRDFKIIESKKTKEIKFIPPDLRICEKCLKELFDPKNRRYKYPFINCTNCGPRFTIILDTPYDRKNTTMNKFLMCSLCDKEYRDINNRRYHAEPNACSLCGPEVILQDNKGKIIKTDDVFKKIKNLLKQGAIIAIKGLGGFHIAADATKDDVVFELRKRKKRTLKPFAIMSDTIEKIKKYAFVSKEEENLLKSEAAPIVLLREKENNLISKYVAEGLAHIGVFLPYTPLHYLLFDKDITALVMTSANFAEEPIEYKNEDAFLNLKELVDYFLLHNRDINIPADDSVIKPYNSSFVFIRRSRGYVPLPVKLNMTSKKDIIGVGALLKNTVCFIKENYAIMSQHIGDLENEKAYNYFTATIKNFVKFYELNPRIIVSDLHPDYLSTRFAEEYAKENKIKLLKIQHHYAHFLSCMAENNFFEKAIGVIFDGTGFGEDGNIWGGEFLVGDFKNYKRVAHFKYRKLAGGDAANKESFRMGISLLSEFLSFDEIKRIYNDKNVELIHSMLKNSINSPLTSSAGRIFDAVASLLDICHISTYEAEAPMRLEAIAHNLKNKEKAEIYPYGLKENNDILEIDIIPAIKYLLEIKNKREKNLIAYEFHKTMADIILNIVNIISKKYKTKNVILSGGVFQNTILLTESLFMLKQNRYKVFIHKKLSPNDSSIALGQAVYAMKNLRR